MGLPTATPAQDRAVYLLLAVTFSSDLPCIYSHRPVVRKADGEHKPTLRLRTEPVRQPNWCVVDVPGQLPLDASGCLVRTVFFWRFCLFPAPLGPERCLSA